MLIYLVLILSSHITDYSATLIDNIFSTVLDDNASGVIVNNIIIPSYHMITLIHVVEGGLSTSNYLL